MEEAELASLHVVAGIELPGREIPWADPFPEEAKKDPVETFVAPLGLAQKLAEVQALPFLPASEPGAESEGILAETFMISDVAARKLARAVATPFEKPPEAPAEAENALAGTQTLSASVALSRAAPALPFKSHWSTPLPRSKSSAAIEPEPKNKVEEDRATPAPRAPSSAAPDGENLLGETFVVPADMEKKLAGAPATPFERVDREVLAPSEPELLDVEVDDASAEWVSEGWSEDAQTPLVAAVVSAPQEVARPALLSAPAEQESAEPMGLGAEFLAAMSASE